MLKTVLIGEGGIAWKHCEALRKLGVEISGIYDVNPVNAGRLAEAFGCPALFFGGDFPAGQGAAWDRLQKTKIKGGFCP